MARSILIFPHPGLARVAAEVDTFDAALEQTFAEMLQIMYSHDGIGLAATQVNIHQRLFVMDLSEERNQPQCLVNPEIVLREGSEVGTEGCLSFPGLFIDVVRAESITVKALNEKGEPLEFSAAGLHARCIQHELDHLDGVVFIDHLSRMKRERAVKKLEKLKKQADQST